MSEPAKTIPRILIVDDTPKNIQVLGTTLRQQNYQIYVAQNGLQALKMLEDVRPELILLDVMMPELDGFETCKRLKDNPRTRDIPVIFLTAKAESEDVVRGFELGAVDYVTKPFNAVELLARVRTHLELQANRKLIEHVSNERKELLHVLSHDLANSLGAIVSMMDILEFPEGFAEIQEHVRNGAQNALNLIGLVREMRALEDYKLEMRHVDLRQALDKSAALLRNRFKEKQLTLDMRVADGLTVWAEETTLVNSVLNNLLTNAIKFSYPGSAILVQAEPVADGVELRVQDTGIGMSQRLLNDVFSMHKATSRAGTQGERGTGFGMPLVKKFIEAYGGTICMTSRSEKEHPQDHGTNVLIHFRVSDPHSA